MIQPKVAQIKANVAHCLEADSLVHTFPCRGRLEEDGQMEADLMLGGFPP
jgi:hypothetical protein